MIYALSYSKPTKVQNKHIISSFFFLGVFSSIKKIKRAITKYSTVSGFKDDPNCFVINPIHLNSKKTTIYQVGICYIGKEASDDFDLVLGYYDSFEKAKKEVQKTELFEAFHDYIVIEKITIDKLEWLEGFNE